MCLPKKTGGGNLPLRREKGKKLKTGKRPWANSSTKPRSDQKSFENLTTEEVQIREVPGLLRNNEASGFGTGQVWSIKLGRVGAN